MLAARAEAAARTLLVLPEAWPWARLWRAHPHTSYTSSKVRAAASALVANIAAAGPDFEAVGPDFEAAKPDLAFAPIRKLLNS